MNSHNIIPFVRQETPPISNLSPVTHASAARNPHRLIVTPYRNAESYAVLPVTDTCQGLTDCWLTYMLETSRRSVTHFVSSKESLHPPRSGVDSIPQKIRSLVSHWFTRINSKMLRYFQWN